MPITPSEHVTPPTAEDTLDTWLDYWGSIHVSAIDLGLERVQPVAERLGVQQPDAAVYTVAGTNGKGSTTTTLAAILQATGRRVALYQSPHIVRFNERIRINGLEVADQQLIDAFGAVEQARQRCGLTLSFFEATTLAAFHVFKQLQCEVWVLEIGLGGRLDVVNLIDADVAVITNIGLDHTDWLGDTIEQIAFEKSGIMRAGRPVIFAGNQPLPQVIADRAEALGAPLTVYGRDYHINTNQSPPTANPPKSQDWQLAAPALTLALPVGQLAPLNQAAAVMAALNGPIPVSHAHLCQGVTQARLAGRFEVRHIADRTVILDVAHNPHGVKFLLQQLRQYQQQHPALTDVVAVCSMLGDKDIGSVVQCLAPVIKAWYIAALDVPRAAPLQQLQDALQDQGVASAHIHSQPTIAQALAAALADSTPQTLIVVCGSFHTLAAVWENTIHGN